MPQVADIFRLYGPAYLERFGPTMLPSHRRALQDLVDCRTSALGGQVYQCNSCGWEHYVYHSCRNRSCPKCHAADTQAWVSDRRNELLPVGYFHVGFTLPEELRPIARSHQKVVYGLMMKAAAASLIKLAADPHYVGGLIGVMTVLHTWSRTLTYHPHVHCLVPAGGVTDDGRWVPARSNYLVPVTALSKIFRGMFRDLVTAALPDVQFPPSVWRRDWVVYCKPAVQGADRVLQYLARYVHRIAITNGRILAIDDGRVTFSYQKTGESCWRTMTLNAEEFIRRFLQHVLPSGVHKVRYYGLWAPANRPLLRRVQVALLSCLPPDPPVQTALPAEPADPCSTPRGSSCPFCSTGTLLFLRRVAPQTRAPP